MNFILSVFFSVLLAPFSFLFAVIATLRAFFFDTGVLKQSKVSVPVISVGNLTTGGTGKTPVVQFLLGRLKRLGKTAGIVSRGYGGEVKQPTVLPGDMELEELARKFGDEPAMYRSMNSNFVGVGTRRFDVSLKLLKTCNDVEVIVADDTFQHRYLYRDLDIVVLDATRPMSDYRFLPMGRARESFHALRRADLVFLTKVNLVDRKQLSRLYERAERFIKSDVAIVELDFKLDSIYRLGNQKDRQELDFFKQKKTVLLSALGNPAAFEAQVRETLGANVLKHFRFADHHRYCLSDLGDVVNFCTEQGIADVLLTEKDAVKIGEFESRKIDFWVVALNVSPTNSAGLQEIDEKLKKIFTV